MWQRGDRVPHFDVSTLSGGRVSYSTIWQQKNLLLVLLPADPAAGEETYVRDLTAGATRFTDTVCVITRDPIGDVPRPAAVIADKWGEVVHATRAASVAELPSADDLLDWIEYVRNKCPECEGETK